MVLIVSPRNGKRREPMLDAVVDRLFIITVKGHRRRIIVKFIEAHLEFLYHMAHQRHDHVRSLDRKKTIETTSRAVVL